MAKPRGKYLETVSMFGLNPCPHCGAPRKIYEVHLVRGPKTKGGGHRPGEHRVKRELRATCGKKSCVTLERARTLTTKHRR